MRTPLKAAMAAAAIAGAGLTGFGITSALAQTDEAPADTTDQVAPDQVAPDQVAPDQVAPDQPGCEGRGGPGLEAMAEVIGIDVEDLHAALEDGQTPAEVAEANGVSRSDLVDAIVADINDHIDQEVEDGHLTEAEADERRADVEDHANAIVDGERPERPEGMGPGGPPPTGDQQAPADGTDA